MVQPAALPQSIKSPCEADGAVPGCQTRRLTARRLAAACRKLGYVPARHDHAGPLKAVATAEDAIWPEVIDREIVAYGAERSAFVYLGLPSGYWRGFVRGWTNGPIYPRESSPQWTAGYADGAACRAVRADLDEAVAFPGHADYLTFWADMGL